MIQNGKRKSVSESILRDTKCVASYMYNEFLYCITGSINILIDLIFTLLYIAVHTVLKDRLCTVWVTGQLRLGIGNLTLFGPMEKMYHNYSVPHNLHGIYNYVNQVTND